MATQSMTRQCNFHTTNVASQQRVVRTCRLTRATPALVFREQYTSTTRNVLLSNLPCFSCTAGQRQRTQHRLQASSRTGDTVIDKPSTALPDAAKSTQSKKQRPPNYKVLLHNDSYNKREYVVKVLLKVVDGMGVEKALSIMQEAHQYGKAIVIECAQCDAEQYCETLRLNGLTSSLEPGC